MIRIRKKNTRKYEPNVNETLEQVHTYTTLPIYSSYPTVLHHSIPYVAHKRLVTGTRISVTPSRTITRVISSPVRGVTPFRAYTPIRAFTPIRAITPLRYTYPITSVSVLSAPSRYIHSYTARTLSSPTRTTFSVRVRPSVLGREFKRIENKVRTTPYHSYTESFLNSDVSRVSSKAKLKHISAYEIARVEYLESKQSNCLCFICNPIECFVVAYLLSLICL